MDPEEPEKIPRLATRVLVDTSIWIDFFQGTLRSIQKDALVLLLEAEEVVITDVIKHELLVGTNSDLEYAELKDYLSALQEVSIEPGQREAFNRFGFDLKKKGLLGKYTDASIAFVSSERKLALWSFDRYFAKLAEKKVISLFEV